MSDAAKKAAELKVAEWRDDDKAILAALDAEISEVMLRHDQKMSEYQATRIVLARRALKAAGRVP